MNLRRRFLFIHQNFPGQFVHISAELARFGHEVVALGVEERSPVAGVRGYRYRIDKIARASDVPFAREFETKVVRGSACAAAMEQLAKSGFTPDTIVAHPAWGESLFCKDIWPDARLVVFSEFFFNPEGADYAFDPEFSRDTPSGRSSLRMKNTALLHALHACDAAYAPTMWQKSQVPPEYRDRVEVIFDGIDTARVVPDPNATFSLGEGQAEFKVEDEVITFVNRNLEPYRGFHIFMRALPTLLEQRPNAHVIVVGRDGISYGRKRKDGRSWREAMLAEVGHRIPPERVHFVGALPYQQYLKVLQISTCHVYLTYPFVLSWSCIEAMSAGCMVVASDTAPVREVIRNGVNGRLVNFFDVDGLAQLVGNALANRKASIDLRRAARDTVINRYDLTTRCLPELVSLLQRR